MRLVKIAIGNVNSTVGAVRSNVDSMLAMARDMAAQGVTLGCFPEQAVGGYPPEDLISSVSPPRPPISPPSSSPGSRLRWAGRSSTARR
jgi:predicted amidohydrolase